ncbi:MAG TPA: alpha/beta hydrolase [Dehalococcoidia bacterium]|nr:alpha/beta hydrolase [Dehalococcoidia bacterium]
MGDTWVERDGVRLFVRDLGGDGPPLLMLHSTGFGHWMWQPHARELSRRFHVYAPDQRGHGDSDKVEGFAFDNLAADMEAVFAALGLDGVYAIGHSAGATTLAYHAALHPGRIRRLLMVEPVTPTGRGGHAAPAGMPGPNAMADRTRRRRASFASPQEMFESFRDRPPFDSWTEESLRLYCEQGTRPAEGGVVLKCPPELEARFYEAVAESDVSARFDAVRIPVRVLWGEHGHAGGVGLGGRTGTLVPGGEARTIPGTTHFIPMEKPEVVVAEALEFFGKDAN